MFFSMGRTGYLSSRGARFSERSIKRAKLLIAALSALLLCACASTKTPERLYSVDEETKSVRGDIKDLAEEFTSLQKGERRRARNEIVMARKFAMDMQYTQYEAELTREIQLADFAAGATSQALSTAALLTPVNHTKDMLTGLGTGVGGISTAYSDKVLRGKLIESIQSSMRAARHERATTLYANMRCSIKSYPMAMALADLEAYYRAGTFTGGLIKLVHTVSKEEQETADVAEAHKPGDTNGTAKLEGKAKEASEKVKGANKEKTRGKHRCEWD